MARHRGTRRNGGRQDVRRKIIVNCNDPKRCYYLLLRTDYPLVENRKCAVAAGIDSGGEIFIRGQPNGLGKLVTTPTDWAARCVALLDTEIEELWRVVANGATVEIRP